MAGPEYKRNRRDWYLCHVIWDISHGGRWLPDAVRRHGIRDHQIDAYIIYDKRLPLRCGAAHISAAQQRGDIRLPLASNSNRCLHGSRKVILAVPLPAFTIFSRKMPPSAGAPYAASRRGWVLLTTSGAQGDGGATSRGAPFRAEMGTFLFWAVHWGMSDGYIVGFVRLVYCCCCLTDLSKLFCSTYNIDICMMIWHM